MEAAVRAAGVAHVPHDFRRTAIRNLERDGVPPIRGAMSMVGQKTEEVYRRYAIVDQAMLGEAAVKMTDGRRFGELLHNELHNRIGHRWIAEIISNFDTVRWPSGRRRRFAKPL